MYAARNPDVRSSQSGGSGSDPRNTSRSRHTSREDTSRSRPDQGSGSSLQTSLLKSREDDPRFGPSTRGHGTDDAIPLLRVDEAKFDYVPQPLDPKDRARLDPLERDPELARSATVERMRQEAQRRADVPRKEEYEQRLRARKLEEDETKRRRDTERAKWHSGGSLG